MSTIKQKYRVIELHLSNQSTIAGKKPDIGVWQSVHLEPIVEDREAGPAFSVSVHTSGMKIDNSIIIHCWRDQRAFAMGEEVYLEIGA